MIKVSQDMATEWMNKNIPHEPRASLVLLCHSAKTRTLQLKRLGRCRCSGGNWSRKVHQTLRFHPSGWRCCLLSPMHRSRGGTSPAIHRRVHPHSWVHELDQYFSNRPRCLNFPQLESCGGRCTTRKEILAKYSSGILHALGG